MALRIIAVDWSGAAASGGSRNALAEAAAGRLLDVEDHLTRRQVVDRLIEIKKRSERAVIGLDFGFSAPAWYMAERGFAEAPELWRWLADGDHANELLRECAPPFWGLKGKLKPKLSGHFRGTELAVKAVRGIRPKSVFQISGPGTVGTGSIRGMCVLHELRYAGFSIWPFDYQAAHTIVEIYPRLLTGPVNKRDRRCRRAYLGKISDRMDEDQRAIAGDSEDAFDAAASALAMSNCARDLASLPRVRDPQLRLEGVIWHPQWRQTLRA
jgi:hypothetical protein